MLPVLFAACTDEAPVREVHSVAVPLPDGTRLAADVILPVSSPGPAPTILIQTRYWRSFALRVPDAPGRAPVAPREPIADRFAAAGYAVVVVDVRGTGASEGAWRAPFSPQEVQDTRAVLDWIVAHPWSDGRVGSYGISYEGSTALLAAATGHPALRAALARQVEWDLLDELIAPGGVRNVSFAPAWGQAVTDLDQGRYPSLFPASARLLVRGVRPLDDDPGGERLGGLQAARRPPDVGAAVARIRSPGDVFGDSGLTVAELGPSAHAGALAASSTRIGVWGSWWDAATALAVLRAWDALPGLVDARIGAWNHEGTAGMAPPLGAPAPPVGEDEVVQWFGQHLVGDGAPRHFGWYEAGADVWHDAPAPPATRERAWALGADGVLVEAGDGGAPPPPGPVVLPTSPGEGTATRWTTGLLRDAAFPDSTARDQGRPAWTSGPLGAPLRVFGRPRLDCPWTAAPTPAALHAYLRAVGPDGSALPVTEGVLRADGAATGLDLLPTALRLPGGWALRLVLAGADPDNFEALGAGGPAWTLPDDAACRLVIPEVAG